jgi:hypothetical protein
MNRSVGLQQSRPVAFEVFLGQGSKPSLLRRLRLPTCLASISLHVGLLVVLGIQSFWRVEEISPRGVVVTFLSVGTPPVPPPPPPPRKGNVAERPRTAPAARVRPDQLLAPHDSPPQAEPRTGESGRLHGAVTGIAAPETLTTRAPAIADPWSPQLAEEIVDLKPVMLGSSMGVSQRLSDLSDPRFRPSLPPPLNRPGTTLRGLFKICVSAGGQVSDVKVLRSADPLVDGDWTAVIRRWQYKPFNLNGHPTPFCHPLTLEVQSMRG